MALPGYRLSPSNKCLDPVHPHRLQGLLNRDITDLTILLERGETPERVSWTVYGLDLAILSDLCDAKAGPITGIPPGKSYNP
jgi:hypothetical protein